MGYVQRVGFASVLLTLLGGFFLTASAERFTGGSYTIDASVVGNSFGGANTGGSYTLTSSGGESVIGQGSGGSYKLGSGYVAQLESSLQLTIQPGGLVAYYPLDEASGGAIYDNSIYSNNGTVGGTSSWQTGKIRGGLTVDPSATASVKVSDNANLPTGSQMSVGIWAKPAASATNRALVSQWDYSGGNPQDGGWALQTSNTDSSRLRFFIAESAGDPGNNNRDTPVNSWTGTAWKHVMVTFDGTRTNDWERIKIYIDGVEQTTSGGGTIPSTIRNSGAPLVIGDFMGLDRQFNGILDEVKLFNRTLSADEVKAEYDAGIAGNASGLAFASAITPGISQTSNYDAAVHTDASNGYNLSVSQNQNLTNGGNTISPVSGSIASPVSWVEGTTKGLGFSLYGTNATAIPGKWSSGNAYAAFPGSATSFYVRSGKPSSKDVVNMRLRLDVPTTQVSGSYTNVITTTGTITP